MSKLTYLKLLNGFNSYGKKSVFLTFNNKTKQKELVKIRKVIRNNYPTHPLPFVSPTNLRNLNLFTLYIYFQGGDR